MSIIATPWDIGKSSGGFETVICTDRQNVVATAVAFTVIRGPNGSQRIIEAEAAATHIVHLHNKCLELAACMTHQNASAMAKEIMEFHRAMIRGEA